MNKIIGYGTVGNNLRKELSNLSFEIIDKYKKIDIISSGLKDVNLGYDIAFICVDTPLIKDKRGKNTLDITEVKNAILENESDIYVVKSTVPVGTIENLRHELKKNIVYSPEYYGGTQHCNNFEFEFTILGGPEDITKYVQYYLQYQYDARHRFYKVADREAEIVKLMENSWLATKVTFCNEFQQACIENDIDYDNVRELFVLDPRVNPSHTFVYVKHPWFDSHCLNKDVPAAADTLNIDLLKEIIEINENRKY